MKLIYRFFFVALFFLFLPGKNNAQNSTELKTTPKAESLENKTEVYIKEKSLSENNTSIKPNAKTFVEKWQIKSARPVDLNNFNEKYKLSDGTYIVFLDYRTVVVKLNDNFSEQIGEYVQSPLSINIKLNKNLDCNNCPEIIIITRDSENSTEFKFKVDGLNEQFFTNKIFKN